MFEWPVNLNIERGQRFVGEIEGGTKRRVSRFRVMNITRERKLPLAPTSSSSIPLFDPPPLVFLLPRVGVFSKRDDADNCHG